MQIVCLDFIHIFPLKLWQHKWKCIKWRYQSSYFCLFTIRTLKERQSCSLALIPCIWYGWVVTRHYRVVIVPSLPFLPTPCPFSFGLLRSLCLFGCIHGSFFSFFSFFSVSFFSHYLLPTSVALTVFIWQLFPSLKQQQHKPSYGTWRVSAAFSLSTSAPSLPTDLY